MLGGDEEAVAIKELDDRLTARGWGSAHYAAGMVVFDFATPEAYTQEDAHRSAVEMIDHALDDLGLDSYRRRWTRVEPLPVLSDSGIWHHRQVIETRVGSTLCLSHGGCARAAREHPVV